MSESTQIKDVGIGLNEQGDVAIAFEKPIDSLAFGDDDLDEFIRLLQYYQGRARAARPSRPN